MYIIIEFFLADTACRVASLAAKDHFLFAAAKGIILYLNCETMEVVRTVSAYQKAVRSLLMINYSGTQSKPFDRLVSRTDSLKSNISRYSAKSRRNSSCDDILRPSYSSLSSLNRLQSSRDSFDAGDDGTSNSVLVSFGVGYNGVVRDSPNHPDSFVLPSEGTRNLTQSALPDKSVGYLLLWSTETDKRAECNECEFNIHDIDEIDENEELSLPDDVVTSY